MEKHLQTYDWRTYIFEFNIIKHHLSKVLKMLFARYIKKSEAQHLKLQKGLLYTDDDHDNIIKDFNSYNLFFQIMYLWSWPWK